MDPRAHSSRMLRSKLNATGKEQDCLGMTPLHILACSTGHDLRLYQLLIEKYPEHLIAKDRWSDVPLLYVFWSHAPREVFVLLIERLKTLFPDHVLDWLRMVETLSRAHVPLLCIQNMLEMQQMAFPNQDINWQEVLTEWATQDAISIFFDPDHNVICDEMFRCLLKFSIFKRLNLLGVEKWRKEIDSLVDTFPSIYLIRERTICLKILYSKLASYEQLKDAASLLELALWKAKIGESMPNNDRQGEKSCQKRARIDVPSHRNQCRINSGAEIVVPSVLPLLLPATDEGTADEGSTEEGSSDEGIDA